MNDRLMIAAMVTNGLLSSGRLRSLDTNRIAIDALAMADALLAAAGEQRPDGDSDFYKSMVRYREEAMAQIARAEAAEAKVAELQAKLAAAARLAQDSAEAAGEMVGGAIQCPQCWGNCLKFTWHDWSRCACRGSGTITDRRKPTANDRALERILDAVDHARAIGMTLSPEFIEDIIREEAERDQQR